MATRRDRYAAERLRLQAGLEIGLGRRAAALVRADILAAADPAREGGMLNLELGARELAWRRLLIAHSAVTARSFGRHTLGSLGDRKASWLDIVLGWIEIQAARKAKLILGTTVAWLREQLAEGEEQGLGVPEIARTIRSEADGISRARALVIARTETHAAATFASEAAAASTGLDLIGEWIAVEDKRTRDTHAAADGQKRPIGEPFDVGGYALMRPGDPDGPPEETINCFLPGTMVSGAFVAGSKARYSGPAWEIETARGHRLRVTPNHPVLTTEGWVAAHALREGDHLLSGALHVQRGVQRNVHDQHGPSAIEDVFDAIAANGTRGATMPRALDFHGDGRMIHGNVDVVLVDGLLRRHRKARFAESVGNLALVTSNAQHPALGVHGALADCLDRVLSPSARLPGGSELSFDITARGALPLHAVRIGTASQWDAPLREEATEGSPGHAEFVRELLDAASGEVSEDNVVRVREFSFCGHVYDLQSVTGWMIADGIACSNCRCQVLYDTKGPE